MAGAPVEIIESYREKLKLEQDSGCEIWQENLESFSVFQALTTQWRISDMGYFFGLSYPAVESVLNMMGFNRKRNMEIFEDIRIMENAALEVLNKDKK